MGNEERDRLGLEGRASGPSLTLQLSLPQLRLTKTPFIFVFFQATVPSLPPRPSLQLRGSAGSIECASGHDAPLDESPQVDTRRTTILQQDAWVISPATALETSFSPNRSSTNSRSNL